MATKPIKPTTDAKKADENTSGEGANNNANTGEGTSEGGEKAEEDTAKEGEAPKEPSDDEKALEARKKRNEEIKRFEEAIAKADAKKAKYEGDDEDTVLVREVLQTKNPALWEIIQNEPTNLRKELEDYKMSSMTPEQREATMKYKDIQERKDAILKEEAEFKEANLAKYPEIFGVSEKTTTRKKADGEKSKAGETKPFTGTLYSVEDDEAFIQKCVKEGITGENDIIRKRYGSDFTIQGSSPRARIHSLRLKLNLVPKKA